MKTSTTFNMLATATATTNTLMQSSLTPWYKAVMAGEESDIFPILDGFNGVQVAKMTCCTVKSAFLAGFSNTYLAQAAVASEMGITIDDKQANKLVNWGINIYLSDKLTKSETPWVHPITNKVSNPAKRDVLPAALELWESHKYEAAVFNLTEAPAEVDPKHLVKRKSSPKATAVETFVRTSYYNSTPSDEFVALVQRVNNTAFKWADCAESNAIDWMDQHEEDTDIAAAVLESTMSNPGAFFLEKRSDGRGRLNERAGLMSIQQQKLVKYSMCFAESAPIDEHEINVLKGKILLGGKPSDEVAAAAGAAWDGLNSDGSANTEASTLFSNPESAFCWLDANQQGFQLLGMLLNDTALMTLTNVIGDKISDLYGMAAGILSISRAQAKSILIPYVYGAGNQALANDYTKDHGIFMDETTMKSMVEQLEAAFPSICALKRHLREAFKFANLGKQDAAADAFRDKYVAPNAKVVMPDGFVMDFEVWEHKNLEIGKGYKADKHLDFKVRIDATKRRDVNGMITALAPNLIHCLDAYLLRKVMSKCDFDMVSVHDNYGCHSSNVSHMRAMIVESMQELCREDILNHMITQLVVRMPINGKGGTTVGRLGSPADWTTVTNPSMFM
jgi:hypothetical protein